MCGIVGIYRFDGRPARREDAAAMAATLRHRGPDGEGAFASGPVALGHARLAIRDRTDAGAQPMVLADGGAALVYNGEVYNDGALRSDLARDGVEVRSTGDAEVVLRACAAWGVERAARRFDGMFAFAYFDAREGALWLVRDRFGTKPLHALRDGARLLFGSEARAIAAGGAALRVDPLAVVRRVFPWTADHRPPPFVGLRDVGPGEAWRVTAAGVERRVWCDVVEEVDPARIVAAAREPVAATLARVEATVEAAVRAHVVSDVPVAAFVSGGVDSNLVAAISREARPDLVGYTMDCGGPESEVETARRCAAHIGLPLEAVRLDRETFLRAWVDATHGEEAPTLHESHAANLVLARAARAGGASVVLTGEGADEIFGGYDTFRRTRVAWARAHRPWSRLTHRGRAAQRRLAQVPFRYQAIRDELETHARYEMWVGPEEESRARRLMDRFAPIHPIPDRAVAANMADAMRRYLGRILFRHDRTCMAASLESRVPFVSNPVADLGLHLPVPLRLKGRTGKWALKQVARRRLLPEVIFARKKGFPVNDAHHRGTAALLRDGWVAETFGWSRATQDELIPRVEAEAKRRFPVVSVELFGRLFDRGEPRDAVAARLLR